MTHEAIVIEAPVGPLRVEGTADAVTCVRLRPRNLVASGPATGAVLEAARQLKAYFAGGLRRFDVPLAIAGTAFQRQVWEALRGIDYGQTCTYQELAARIGRPTAVRAVGAANGQNPIPIIVPCHRVIGSNGRLVGFGGGIAMKQQLLELEGARLF